MCRDTGHPMAWNRCMETGKILHKRCMTRSLPPNHKYHGGRSIHLQSVMSSGGRSRSCRYHDVSPPPGGQMSDGSPSARSMPARGTVLTVQPQPLIDRLRPTDLGRGEETTGTASPLTRDRLFARPTSRSRPASNTSKYPVVSLPSRLACLPASLPFRFMSHIHRERRLVVEILFSSSLAHRCCASPWKHHRSPP